MNLFKIASRLISRIASLQSVQNQINREFHNPPSFDIYPPTMKSISKYNEYEGEIDTGWVLHVREDDDPIRKTGWLRIRLNGHVVKSFKDAAMAYKKKDPKFLAPPPPIKIEFIGTIESLDEGDIITGDGNIVITGYEGDDWDTLFQFESRDGMIEIGFDGAAPNSDLDEWEWEDDMKDYLLNLIDTISGNQPDPHKWKVTV